MIIGFRKVSGGSMLPRLHDGQTILLVSGSDFRDGDIVVVEREGREVIKRVIKKRTGQYWIEGDNKPLSTDSRHFGWVDKSDILGVMKYSLPVAQDPPKLRQKQGHALGWVAASIMIVFALVHLFRIDTFVPELDQIFLNRSLTMWIASLVVVMEVFAIPFLLRMRLSPLAQYVSGAFAIIVPLIWTLITIWTFGTGVSTAQLGEFVMLQSSWVLLLVNILWLAFSYYTVWALGYDHRPGEKKSLLNKWLSRLSK